MEVLDTKPLSTIQKKELSDLLVSFHIHKNDQALNKIFEIYDRNGDGSISESEFKITLETIVPEDLIDGNISNILREADTNMNGVIDFEEFKNFMLKMRSM
jgi:Ca2+-binding EF-hand superfamily protein